MHWDGGEVYSIGLGHEKFPLFKFCFDYIKMQNIDTSQIPIAEEAFANMQLYDERKTVNDPDLLVLYEYYCHYEKDVRKTVQTITERLKNPEDISFYDYGAIAGCLISIKYYLGIDIQSAKQRLIDNLKGRGNELRLEELFRMGLGSKDEAIVEEYKEMQKAMELSLKENEQLIPGFDYSAETIEVFCRYILDKYGVFYTKRRFAQDLDIKRFSIMFSQCTPGQKQYIRIAFNRMYGTGNIRQFLGDDFSAIKSLRDHIAADVEHQSDKIQRLQYELFLDNLDEILQKLQ